MILFDKIPDLMRDLKTSSVIVMDTAGKMIFRHDGDSVEHAIVKLENVREMLTMYGRVTMKACTNSQAKQNWKDCFNWTVFFTAANTHTPAAQQNQMQPWTNFPQGYISRTEAEALGQLAALKEQAEIKKQFDELKMSIALQDKNDPMKYIGLLPLFFDVDEKKMAAMAKMHAFTGAQGLGNLQGAKVAAEKTTVLQKQGTAEEQAADEKKISDAMDNMQEAYQSGKLNLDLLNKITAALKKDPTILESLAPLLK